MEHRYQLADAQWNRIQDLLPGRPGTPGIHADNRRFLNAVLWILWTTFPLANPAGATRKVEHHYRRFSRWSQKGVWQKVVEVLRRSEEFQWLMIDSTVIRAHQRSAGKKGAKCVLRRAVGA